MTCATSKLGDHCLAVRASPGQRLSTVVGLAHVSSPVQVGAIHKSWQILATCHAPLYRHDSASGSWGTARDPSAVACHDEGMEPVNLGAMRARFAEHWSPKKLPRSTTTTPGS